MRAPALLVLASVAALSSCASAPRLPPAAVPPPEELRWERIGEGIEFARLASRYPRVEGCALRIDLATESLEVLATPGAGGFTASQRVTSFARETGCIAAINTTPFEPSSAIEGEKRKVVGLAIAEGRAISAPVPGMAVLILRRERGGALRGEVAIQGEDAPIAGEGEVLAAAAGGFSVVLRDGEPVGRARKREPRTAAGLSADGRTLYLLVADGRRPGSAGLSDYDVGAWLARLGAREGMTFDGGGSSEMALRGADGRVRAANLPSDGIRPGRERAVGSCLGFRSSRP